LLPIWCFVDPVRLDLVRYAVGATTAAIFKEVRLGGFGEFHAQ